MSDEKNNGADVELNVAGQKMNFRNIKSLNTLATIATLVIVCVLGYAIYMHASDTRDASKELVSALKEMTQVAREQNCLISMTIEERRRDPERCRRIAR